MSVSKVNNFYCSPPFTIVITFFQTQNTLAMTDKVIYLDIIIKHSVVVSITLQQLKGPLALKIFKLLI